MLVVDSGPLCASIDRDDAHHGECTTLLLEHPGPLVVPCLVVTEVAYLIATRLGSEPEVRLLQDFAEGNLVLESVEPRDWLRIAELVHRYRDLPLGTVGASVVAAAERLGVEEVASLDRRHLGAIRPRHVERLRLLP